MEQTSDMRQLLRNMWQAGVAAAGAKERLPAHLPSRPRGRVIVVGAGKAAAAMAAVAADFYGPRIEGVVVTRHGHGLWDGETSGAIRIVEARHPVPDEAGLLAGRAVLSAVAGLTEHDLVLCLLSGGGSALLEVPLDGVGLDDIKKLNSALLVSGAAIGEINCVRKHLSQIKGGRLALAASPAQLVTLAISDVPGDNPSTIASGPTVADPTNRDDALAILKRYRIPIPTTIDAVLRCQTNETPKPGDPRLKKSRYTLIATQADALSAAEKRAQEAGFPVVNLGTRIEGEARAVAIAEARSALEFAKRDTGIAILAGGELTVTLNRSASGGANREYALALALQLGGHPRIWGLAADTDGIDGTEDGAGAFVTPDTLERAAALGLDAANALDAHDSGAFFAALGDTLVTGPTRTNVSDFRAIVVLPDK